MCRIPLRIPCRPLFRRQNSAAGARPNRTQVADIKQIFGVERVPFDGLGWLEALGYTVRHGPEIAFGIDGGERSDPGYHDTILQNRLHRALTRLNPGLPTAAVFDAYRKLLRVETPNLLARNRAFHRMLVDGVNVEYARLDGSIAGAQAQIIDFERPEHNDWLAVNQFTVVEGQQSRRADIVIFVNGLPLGVIELKNPADEDATIWKAVE